MRVVTHPLSLALRELDQVEADLDDDVLHLVDERLMESALSRSDAQRVDKLDNELRVVLIVEELLEVGIRGEALGRVDQICREAQGLVNDG